MGLVRMGCGLGIMVGPLLGGLLFDLQGHYGAAYLLAMALLCVAIGYVWGTSYGRPGARLKHGRASH
jgi:MFS family permease